MQHIAADGRKIQEMSSLICVSKLHVSKGVHDAVKKGNFSGGVLFLYLNHSPMCVNEKMESSFNLKLFVSDVRHVGTQPDVFDLHRSANVDRLQRRIRRHRLSQILLSIRSRNLRLGKTFQCFDNVR